MTTQTFKAASLQILVKKLSNTYICINGNKARYIEIVPHHNIGYGVVAEFFSAKGESVVGKVVDLRNFPDLDRNALAEGTLIIDTAVSQ